MLIINYKHNFLNKIEKTPILYSFSDYNKPFFEKTKFEFIKFFNNHNFSAPYYKFVRPFRFKKTYAINDFMLFSRILSRHGLLLKFKTFLINVIFNVTKINLINGLPLISNFEFLKSPYWLYTFDKLKELGFVFRLTFHRLDKNVRKYNRKRKIKLSYKYNYVPPFKRQKWIFSVISKYIKFGFFNSFYKNFLFLLLQIFNFNSKNIFSKINHFVYKKVKNFSYQKTLIKSI